MLNSVENVERPFARAWAEPRHPGAAPPRRGRVLWPDMAAASSPAPPPTLEEPAPPPEPPPPVFAEDEVARLCASAASAAAADTEARVRAELALECRDAEARLASALATLAGAIAGRREGLRAEAVPIGAALGRVLAYEAIGAEPLATAEAVAAGLLAELRDEPEVAVEVAPGLAEELGSRLAALAPGPRAAGAVEVRAGAGLRPGEVRVFWRDGWAERTLARVELRAVDALAALAGSGAGATRGRVVVEGDAISQEDMTA